jgi:TolB-like protein
MSLFAELKRRNVFRVVAMYAVLSWLLLQIAEVVFSFMGVADSAGRILIAYLAIGFIPVVLFSWVYEITPEGVKLESEVDRTQSITSHTAKKLDLAVIVMLLVALGIFLVERFSDSSDPAEQAKEEQAPAASPAASQSTSELARSVAVLPFTDRSSEPDPNRFVDGIHDDLLTQLAKIAAIKVISRTSVMEYRDTTKNLRQIGEELGVATIMEGAVQRIGNRMRINAQLIDASSDEHLWAESYDRELTAANVFDIQTEIARAIAAALEATLSPSEEKQLERRGTDNLEALAAYQRARRLYDRFAFSQNQSAVEAELEHVLALDPNFVSAWAYLARSRLARWWAGSEDPADLEGAWEAIEKGYRERTGHRS